MLSRLSPRLFSSSPRLLSSSIRTLVNVTYPSPSVAVLELDRPPVNSLSLEMATSITSHIKQIESDPQIRSLILTSSNPKIFSAGLDITEMSRPSKTRLSTFWRSIQSLFLTLYSTRLSTISCITGHSPAGGCLLSMSCDYRVMSRNPKLGIGLNETRLGIAAPFWLKDLFVKTVGYREAELGLSRGKLYSPEEALKIGLVDEIVEGEVYDVAVERAEEYAKIPEKGIVATKRMCRGELVRDLEGKIEEDVGWFTDFILEEGTQKGIEGYLKSLSKK
ncbi:hypothetical protein TrVE_jg13516 [Triparma verrucosa]|uniref:Enoyl-CoA delta isomerase 1, mitochondrial n=1 Tax=Triparma verrucosa TaxID=1606542 RepID=A0A9W7F7K2_9STRA|nr:hypothetical protein TrVE_jg13516 [Triparma verrucosa]